MSAFLDEAFAAARQRVARAAAMVPQAALRARAGAVGDHPSFADALRHPAVTVVAEIKRASPSRGRLARIADPAALARAYASGGAGAVSVLTEPRWFNGSVDDLEAVAHSIRLPVLRKDFVLDPYQIWEAAAARAAAVLLIVAGLDDETLVALQRVAAGAHLDGLVEVHDADDARRAVRAHEVAATGRPLILGVNARDLRTLEVDLGTLARVRDAVPDHAILVAESGVHEPDDVRRMQRLGADAVLVGEAVVTAPDPGDAVRRLVEGGRRTAGDAHSTLQPGMHPTSDQAAGGAR